MSKEAELHCDYKSTDGRSVRVLCAELDAKEVLSSTHPIIRQFMCSYQRQGEHLKDLTIASWRRMLQVSQRCRKMQNFTLILNLSVGHLSARCVQS